MPIVDAVKLASKAAAISVTRMGAQTSIPFWQEYNIL
jgi:sugar/nucleoside kinase (ribokinase family)